MNTEDTTILAAVRAVFSSAQSQMQQTITLLIGKAVILKGPQGRVAGILEYRFSSDKFVVKHYSFAGCWVKDIYVDHSEKIVLDMWDMFNMEADYV